MFFIVELYLRSYYVYMCSQPFHFVKFVSIFNALLLYDYNIFALCLASLKEYPCLNMKLWF